MQNSFGMPNMFFVYAYQAMYVCGSQFHDQGCNIDSDKNEMDTCI